MAQPSPAPPGPPAAGGRRCLLAVHAHPDDESITTGGILARYAAEGVRTVVATCTGGDVGAIRDPSLASADTLGTVRLRELAEAARILGVARLVTLGYRDSGMRGWPDNQHPDSLLQAESHAAVGRLVRLIREEGPQVLVTYDEQGNYGHPDHVRAHQLTVAAFNAAGDAAAYSADAFGAPHAPDRLYFVVFGRGRVAAFNQALAVAGIAAPPSALAGATAGPHDPPFGVDDARVTTVVDVSAYLHVKRAALAAHRTQLGPDHWLLRLPDDLARRHWSVETFERAAGPPAAQPGELETDLFAGL